MKHIMNRWFLLFVLLLGMSAVACNLPFGGEEEPTPRATTDDDDDGDRNNEDEEDPAETESAEEPEATTEEEVVVEGEAEEPVEEETEEETAVSEETEETAEEDSSLLGNLFPESLSVRDTVSEFDTLDSYEMEMEFSTTISETTQVVQATIVSSTDPAQTQMTFSFSGFDELAGISSMSMIQIEGTTYMNMAEFGCVTTSEGEFSQEDFGALDATEFLEDIGEATLVGEETINGIDTLHYTFDESVIEDETTQFNWAEGDVYIAKEGNYVVRFRMEGEGTVEDFGVALEEEGIEAPIPQIGLIQIEMNLVNINEPVNITIPEECENGGLANSEYPILEDAFESSSFGGIVTYKTETPFADIVSFYEEMLTADDWVFQEDSSFMVEGSTALMYFDKDGRSLTVTITGDTGSDAFVVVLFEE